MRVDLTAGATISGPQTEKTSSPVAPASASRSAQTHLPESDASVGKLETVALNSPEVRNEKVQALRSQLQSGTYQVSPAQVADSILEQLRVRGS
ncbi:MAG TPA: flagellar biosynthesis anti-sigma factor FlgM [Candidatus Angelobacter sp.]|nr:flagellar biosynthesis anti-sigma factor FlgM [Candidatus Angelobacter sp.]